MPTYEVTLDGRTFELTGDHQPTEEEARQATGLNKEKLYLGLVKTLQLMQQI